MLIKDKNNALITKVWISQIICLVWIFNMSLCLISIQSSKIIHGYSTFDLVTWALSLCLLCAKDMVKGMPNIDRQDQVCEGYAFDKHLRDSFPIGEAWRALSSLKWVHSYLCGPMNTTSIGGDFYFVTFIADWSRKTWVDFLREKFEAFGYFKTFKALVDKQSGLILKTLHSNRGGEYVSYEFEELLGINSPLNTLLNKMVWPKGKIEELSTWEELFWLKW